MPPPSMLHSSTIITLPLFGEDRPTLPAINPRGGAQIGCHIFLHLQEAYLIQHMRQSLHDIPFAHYD